MSSFLRFQDFCHTEILHAFNLLKSMSRFDLLIISSFLRIYSKTLTLQNLLNFKYHVLCKLSPLFLHKVNNFAFLVPHGPTLSPNTKLRQIIFLKIKLEWDFKQQIWTKFIIQIWIVATKSIKTTAKMSKPIKKFQNISKIGPFN